MFLSASHRAGSRTVQSSGLAQPPRSHGRAMMSNFRRGFVCRDGVALLSTEGQRTPVLSLAQEGA